MKDGTFDLSSTTLASHNLQSGVALGKHRIEVSASEMIDEETIRWHAPKKYASFRSSNLEEDIKGDVDSLVIELTWDGVEGPIIEGPEDTAEVTETEDNPDTAKEENLAEGTDSKINE